MNKKPLTIGIVFFTLVLAGCITGVKQMQEKNVSHTYQLKPPTQIYCDHKGSVPQETRNIYGGLSEICVFEDGSECLQWDYFIGKCKSGDIGEIKTNIYFTKGSLAVDDIECEDVYPVDYAVGYHQNWERKALQRLLAGPDEGEVEQGYQTLINKETKLKSFKIEDAVATIDFSKDIKSKIKSDCQKTLLKKQIEMTMTYFGSVESVEILVEGEMDEFLEI